MKKKIVSLALAVCLLAIAAVGTLAYFTDKTDTVKNAFSVGDVSITLDETDIKEPNGPRTSEGNDYGVLMPGDSVVKDPTVHVGENSQESYLFVQIDVTKYMSMLMMYGQLNNVALTDLNLRDNATRKAVVDTYVEGLDHSAWRVMNPEVLAEAQQYYQDHNNTWPTTLSVILGHYETVVHGQDVVVFTGLQLPTGITSDMLENVPNFTKDDFDINVTAYAIQKAQIADLDAAYDALFK